MNLDWSDWLQLFLRHLRETAFREVGQLTVSLPPSLMLPWPGTGLWMPPLLRQNTSPHEAEHITAWGKTHRRMRQNTLPHEAKHIAAWGKTHHRMRKNTSPHEAKHITAWGKTHRHMRLRHITTQYIKVKVIETSMSIYGTHKSTIMPRLNVIA